MRTCFHKLGLWPVAIACTLLVIAGNAAAGTPSPQAGASVKGQANDEPTSRDHSDDFDFLQGHWYVRNRRLLKQLQGSTDWTPSSGTLVGAPLLEGMGNYDELRSDVTGAVGVSVRFFNRQTGQWSDYWISHRDGVLQPAVFGAFVNGVGTFEGEDQLNGKQMLVRQLWSGIATPTPRWEQAFSGDDGKTWETNWVMDFSRSPTR